MCLLSPYEALNIEYGAVCVEGRLVLCCLSDETLRVRESDPRGSDPVPLVVRDDFHMTVLVDSNTRVGRSEVDPDQCPESRGVTISISRHRQSREEC